MDCPRRAESGIAVFNLNKDHYREDDTCSYCGSLNPEILMARLEAGDISLGPTDKNYKVYVHNAGGQVFKQTFRDCYSQGVKDCPGPQECTHWVMRDIEQTKFYFQHLSDEQKNRFIELLNERKFRIGYPGHFYVLPFFIGRKTPAPSGQR
jgi:hypothetical protein